jgi:hypothetical protein
MEDEKLTQVNELKEMLDMWEERNRNPTTRLDQLVYEIGREAILDELSEVSRQLNKPF